MMYQYILFDLDGTLVDSSEGILNSAHSALAAMGRMENDVKMLRRFIGPPLKDTFINLYNMDEDTANEATRRFREYYNAQGKYQCRLYEGIEDTLLLLKKSGRTLFVATSKPTVFSIDILKHLGIDVYFDGIVGSNLDNTRSKKCEIINYILEEYKITDRNSVVMIGDKNHDLIGAAQCNIHGIGVTYGFGDYAELSCEKHDIIVDSPYAVYMHVKGH